MTEGDWPLIEAINNNPEVAYFTEDDDWHPYSIERLQEIYGAISQNALMFVIEHFGQPVGECWLQRMNVRRIQDEFPGQDVRRIDIAIGAAHLWGQGLGSEAIRLIVARALERESVDLLVCFAGGHNPRSKRAFEKAGFSVLRTVPQPDNQESGHGYDCILTPPAGGPGSGHQHGQPVLGEVVVEGEDGLDPQPLDRREASGVGEREGLVVVTLDDLSAPPLVAFRHPHHVRPALVELGQEAQGEDPAQPVEEQSVGLGADEVAGVEPSAVATELCRDRLGVGMILVSRIGQSVEGRAVHEGRADRKLA